MAPILWTRSPMGLDNSKHSLVSKYVGPFTNMNANMTEGYENPRHDHGLMRTLRYSSLSSSSSLLSISLSEESSADTPAAKVGTRKKSGERGSHTGALVRLRPIGPLTPLCMLAEGFGVLVDSPENRVPLEYLFVQDGAGRSQRRRARAAVVQVVEFHVLGLGCATNGDKGDS